MLANGKNMTQDVEIKEQEVKMSFAEFLEGVPPSSNTTIPDLFIELYYQGGSVSGYKLNKPEIQLHCSENSCNGLRFFRCTTQEAIHGPLNEYQFTYIRYLCSNCRKDTKVFALAVTRTDKCEGE